MLRVAGPISHGTLPTNGTHGVDTMTSTLQNISNFHHLPLLQNRHQRHAWLAELFKRPQLQPKPSFDKLYVCVEVSTKTNAVWLNFHHWCETPSSVFSKIFQRRPQIVCTFSVEPLVIYNLCFVQSLSPSARYFTCAPQACVCVSVCLCVCAHSFVRKISQERVHGLPPNLVGGSRG